MIRVAVCLLVLSVLLSACGFPKCGVMLPCLMDRRSFLRGLAATTAAVPIANLAPAFAPMPYYGWSPCMTALEELRKLDELRRAYLLTNPILVVD